MQFDVVKVKVLVSQHMQHEPTFVVVILLLKSLVVV